MSNAEPPDARGSDSRAAIEWPIVLARWTDFARATSRLPSTGPEARWRASVPAIIGLQAIVFALREARGWAEPDRRWARAVASATIERHATELARLWSPMPELMREIVDDARAELGQVAADAPPPPATGA
ncbi:MAG: hypothetical protein AB7K52_05755 [Phycisphaerales bacterium]